MNKLTIERAIADGVSPASLRAVAVANDNKGPRRKEHAVHLRALAKQLELRRNGQQVAA